jgi:hypothetical protein
MSSGIKSRLFNYSAFISKDLTIFAGKSQNGALQLSTDSLMIGREPFPNRRKRINKFSTGTFGIRIA